MKNPDSYQLKRGLAEICNRYYMLYSFQQNNPIIVLLIAYNVGENIIATTPKYELIIVPSNHSNFQYCDSNIELFSIAPCKVITLNPLCIFFGISYLLFFMVSFLQLSLFQLSRQRQLSLFLALKGDSDKINVTFR